MALTVSTANLTGPGKGRTVPTYATADKPTTIHVCEIDFDSSYPTGGETLDFTSSGQDVFRDVHAVIIESKSGYVFEYDYTNKKVKAFRADYDAVADGALIEVANTTDLSAVTDVRVVAFGFK